MPTEEYKNRKKAYIKQYIKDTYSLVTVKLRKKEDKDILDILASVPNKSEFIKDLIRKSKH